MLRNSSELTHDLYISGLSLQSPENNTVACRKSSPDKKKVKKKESVLTHMQRQQCFTDTPNHREANTPSQRKPSEVIIPLISASLTCERMVHWLMLNNNTPPCTPTHTHTHYDTTWEVRGQKKREIITDTDPHKRMITAAKAPRGSMWKNSLYYQGLGS